MRHVHCIVDQNQVQLVIFKLAQRAEKKNSTLFFDIHKLFAALGTEHRIACRRVRLFLSAVQNMMQG